MKKTIKIILIILPVLIISGVGIYIYMNININNYYYNERSHYAPITMSEADIANRYFQQIYEMLKESDISGIVSLIDLEDQKYGALGSGDILEVLNNNNLLESELELVNFKKNNIEGVTDNIYELEIKNKELNVTKNITLKEKYPDMYQIIFNF